MPPLNGHFLLSLTFLAVFFTSGSHHPSLAVADELSVVSHPSLLRLPPGHRVENSPGTRPGSAVRCNRVRIHGLSRLLHPTKFANSAKIRVDAAPGDGFVRLQNVELCFHRNASVGLGMCSASQWKKLSKGSWVQSISPYANVILDIRIPADTSRPIEVSTEEELLSHRLGFLAMGIFLMVLARVLSESVVFFYGGAMAIGIILVVLMVLFQGMRLLPTGRKSSLAIVAYSSIVGVASVLLHYLSGLMRLILVEIGITEDMHNPLAIFLLICLGLVGAWCGYWYVRKLVLTEDGVVDTSVAYFVEWVILIVSGAMILQCSLDPLVAATAMVFAMVMTAIIRSCSKSCHQFKHWVKNIFRTHVQKNSAHKSSVASDSPVEGSANRPPPAPPKEEPTPTYYSIFHKTPDRKQFSKEEWETFTKNSTSRALKELVSSPDFNQWAIKNAERLTLTPQGDSSREKQQRRRFPWF